MNIAPDTLKEILVKSGFIDQGDFADAEKAATQLGRDIADVLIFRGLISEDVIGKLISEYLKVPYVQISKKPIPPEVLSLIPEKLARTYRMVPFEKKDKKLSITLANTEDFEAIEFARRQTNLSVVPFYATEKEIARALSQYKKGIKEDFQKEIEENIKKNS